MSDPCDKGPAIEALKTEQSAQGVKLDQLLTNQADQGNDMKAAIARLTEIIELDIGTRKDVEQGKKELALLFDFHRKGVARIDAIEIRNAQFDGKGIYKKWDQVWNFVQSELGWRRFLPAAMTSLSFLVLIYVTFLKGQVP